MGSSLFSDAGFTSDFAGAPVSDIDTEASGIDAAASDSAEGEADELFNPSLSDGNGISLEAFESGTGDSMPEAGSADDVLIAAEEFDSTELEGTDDLADILPDLSGFSDSSDAVSGFRGIEDTDEISAVGAESGISDTIDQKLENIGKTVNEINIKLSSIENIQNKALAEVAKDAASRAVKITSKSIGEYIHKKLSGR